MKKQLFRHPDLYGLVIPVEIFGELLITALIACGEKG